MFWKTTKYFTSKLYNFKKFLEILIPILENLLSVVLRLNEWNQMLF